MKVKFKAHKRRPRYWSDTGGRELHFEDGDVQDLPPTLVFYLIKHFPLNFTLVDPKQGEVTKTLPQNLFQSQIDKIIKQKPGEEKIETDIPQIPVIEGEQIDVKVLLCPSLSISEDILKTSDTSPGRYDYDVIFIGYAYQSRINWMEKFLAESLPFRILLVGDCWDKQKFNFKPNILPTQDEVATMKLCYSARIIVCLHRNERENIEMPPQSVHRGYIEAYSGSLVMIDKLRSCYPFAEDEVVFFNSQKELKEKITYYLAHPDEAKKMGEKAKKKAERMFTFKTRLTKILNCLRSERYEMKIP